jgi:hypothetical protein
MVNRSNKKEVINLKLGSDLILYILGCKPVNGGSLSFKLPESSSQKPLPEIFAKIAKHPDIVAAKAKRISFDSESRREFLVVYNRVKKEIEESANK